MQVYRRLGLRINLAWGQRVRPLILETAMLAFQNACVREIPHMQALNFKSLQRSLFIRSPRLSTLNSKAQVLDPQAPLTTKKTLAPGFHQCRSFCSCSTSCPAMFGFRKFGPGGQILGQAFRDHIHENPQSPYIHWVGPKAL